VPPLHAALDAHFELFVFAGFPLTREQHAEVRAALAARRG
jgi:hypothetical protein